jgi:hypothetical protein
MFATAFAQVILFYWQLRLMRESVADTKASAEAAKVAAVAATKSANAAIQIELPIIIAEGFRSQKLENTDPFPSDGHPGYIEVQFEFKNHGTTAAELIEYSFESDLSGTLNGPPIYKTILPFSPGIILTTGKSENIRFIYQLSEDAISKARRFQNSVWIYGYVSFYDIFGQTNKSGYCVLGVIDRRCEVGPIVFFNGPDIRRDYVDRQRDE